jgi:hypothetical protein
VLRHSLHGATDEHPKRARAHFERARFLVGPRSRSQPKPHAFATSATMSSCTAQMPSSVIPAPTNHLTVQYLFYL